jgi:hypothetical protein
MKGKRKERGCAFGPTRVFCQRFFRKGILIDIFTKKTIL